ncbi:uncharacterized protein ACB057_008892 [Neosynchiropus ocellatus]
METLIKPPEVLLLLSALLLPALEAQKLEVQPKVTGYTNNEVTLHCRFIRGSEQSQVTAVRWDLVSTGNQPQQLIIAFNLNLGMSVKDTPLKGRVYISGESNLIIHDVQMSDAGTYKCRVITFPDGAFEGLIQLEVQEPKKPELVAVRVVVVLLLIAIMAASVYLVSTRRCVYLVRIRHLKPAEGLFVVVYTEIGSLQQADVTTAAPPDDAVYVNVQRTPLGGPPSTHTAAARVNEVELRGQQLTQEEETGSQVAATMETLIKPPEVLLLLSALLLPEQTKPELVAVIVVVVVLLFIILAATVYLVSTRRLPCRQRGLQQVHVTTAAQLNHDIVYADVRRKEDGHPAGSNPPKNDDNVIYSKVVLRGQQHTQEGEEEEEEMVI